MLTDHRTAHFEGEATARNVLSPSRWTVHLVGQRSDRLWTLRCFCREAPRVLFRQFLRLARGAPDGEHALISCVVGTTLLDWQLRLPQEFAAGDARAFHHFGSSQFTGTSLIVRHVHLQVEVRRRLRRGSIEFGRHTRPQ